jgi:hypothetical protein
MNGSENWVDIIGYENSYQVSDKGRIRTKDRTVEFKNRWGEICGRRQKSIIMKQKLEKNGYLRIGLRDGRKSKSFSVHRLVLEAFSGNRPNLQVNHKDGNKTNNNLGNLEWCTARENYHHAKATGLRDSMAGENSWFSKLTQSGVIEIVKLLKDGVSDSEIGKRFGIGHVAIGRINHGISWRNFTERIVDEYPIKKIVTLNQHSCKRL